MNSVKPKEVPIEQLKIAKDAIEAEEGVEDEENIRDWRRRNSGADLQKHSPLSNGTTRSKDKDEIDPPSSSPLKERTGRDIRFGDLPHPRKDDVIQPVETEREARLGRRTLTAESEIRDQEPRLRRATSTGLTGQVSKTATFERVLGQPFRRRDGSPNSRRSTQTQMTLPYFTFQPTIGRNSVCPITAG